MLDGGQRVDTSPYLRVSRRAKRNTIMHSPLSRPEFRATSKNTDFPPSTSAI